MVFFLNVEHDPLMQEYTAGIIGEGLTDEHVFLEFGYGHDGRLVLRAPASESTEEEFRSSCYSVTKQPKPPSVPV
jgi:hypothetical protein